MSLMLDLFLTFAKIGVFTFGGGYAMISLIQQKCVEEKNWISHDELTTLTAIAESTPGPIAINCATYIGYLQGGVIGSAVATLGMVMPSFIIIYLISVFFQQILEVAWIANAFRGIKAAVGLLIVQAGWNMFKKMKKAPFQLIMMGSALVIMTVVNIFALHFATVYLLMIAAVLGLFLSKAPTPDKGGKAK